MIALVGGIVMLVAIVAIVLLTRDSSTRTRAARSRPPLPARSRQGPEANLPTSVEPPSDGEVLEEGDSATAVVTTNLGEFTIELDTEQAPITANSFAYLAEEGFYDGLIFHRIAPGFVIQGGDPQGTGAGGPGYTCVEKPPREPDSTRRARSRWRRPAPSPPAHRAASSSSSPAPSRRVRPQYALVGR